MSGERDATRRVRAAARNNAELCDLVCRGQGVVGSFATDAWTSPRRTPRYYPDAVTLEPMVEAGGLLARIDASTGASVKDSFATLDLGAASFGELFSAEWIARPADAPVAERSDGRRLRWSSITEARSLEAWESAWSEDGIARGLFASALLGAPEVVVLRGELDETIVAGAILNRSESVVGVSNLFASTGDPVDAWRGCVDEVAARFPGFEIVGYESGAALDVALRAGFESIGALRVWVKE